eukprot:4257844-Karenia_brevis.AAC.1
MISHITRQVSAEESLEDVYFTECSDRYDILDLQVNAFTKTHQVVYVTSNPQDEGDPVSRP